MCAKKMFYVGNIEAKVKNTFITLEEAGDEFLGTKSALVRSVSDPTLLTSASLSTWDRHDGLPPMASETNSTTVNEEDRNEESPRSTQQGSVCEQDQLDIGIEKTEDDSSTNASGTSDIDCAKWPWLRHSGSPAGKQIAEPKWHGDVTTVMMCNVPSRCTQKELVKEINESFANRYDFLYLPIDKTSGFNKGYAFINLKNALIAKEFYRTFHGTTLALHRAAKAITINVAVLQGYEANFVRYAHMMRAGTGRKQTQPLFLRVRDSKFQKKSPSLTEIDPGFQGSFTPVTPPEQYFGCPVIEGDHSPGGMSSPIRMLPAAVQRRAPPKRFCPHCGASVAYSSVVSSCTYCGGELSQCHSTGSEAATPLSTVPTSQPPTAVAFNLAGVSADMYAPAMPAMDMHQFVIVNTPDVMHPLSGAGYFF
eukprot:TRINITY_DN61389_c0_g1_i1.p1 TRINITY_DN61389_c0_g1~~TRINITY_DN61389_c0_g1_i1.p1  ORF type:complete len:422 (+),score=69.48 TRINITY_DN61389_c0_g1_i1:68-1333(+)